MSNWTCVSQNGYLVGNARKGSIKGGTSDPYTLERCMSSCGNSMSITVGDQTDPRCICGSDTMSYGQLSATGGTLQPNGAGSLRTYNVNTCKISNYNQQNQILK